jgi:hypothetical protein
MLPMIKQSAIISGTSPAMVQGCVRVFNTRWFIQSTRHDVQHCDATG